MKRKINKLTDLINENLKINKKQVIKKDIIQENIINKIRIRRIKEMKIIKIIKKVEEMETNREWEKKNFIINVGKQDIKQKILKKD